MFLLSYAQVLRFISPRVFSLIIFTASNALPLSPKDVMSGFIGVSTGFPVMGPLSIFLNYFIIADINFYPNFLVPAFSDIWVNMTFFAIFIKGSVIYFYSCSLMKNCFPDL